MRLLTTEDLPKLFKEVRALVANGVYSLYALPDGSYVLFTNTGETYYLSGDGSVAEKPQGVDLARTSNGLVPVSMPIEGHSVALDFNS
jgi:hypothetical protein